MAEPVSPSMSNSASETGDISQQRPTREEDFSRPPVSMFNNSNRLSMSGSRDSSVIRNINGSFLPGAQTPQSQASLGIDSAVDSAASFSSSILQEEAKLRWDSEEELKKVSKTLLRLQKWSLIIGLLLVNGALIYVAWKYFQMYYLFIILLSSNTMLQTFMMGAIIANAIGRRVIPCWLGKKEIIPEEPEKMVLLLPCYNETHQELTRSLDSLVDQKEIDAHPKVIFIVVDGNARGPGMDKTTQQYLLEDILEPGQCRRFENGYRARDGLFMPVKIQTGFYKGLPYVFVGKSYNQGKRDSLCFARSFLYHFKKRSENILTMFNNDLYEYIGNSFVQHGLDTVDFLVGMDADTVFDEFCIREMLREIRTSPKLVGVCGHVCVDFDGKPFAPWSLYQSVEYSQTQGLRRMFQSRITGKVNCLPGCCQLIRVDESTFGDVVLRERFGYCPKPNDIMTQHIMGNYSEDSIHASIIFSLFPKKQTAQALRAKAFTIVPQNWKVFLSQRKRWALGSISNEFVMIFRPGIVPLERLQSLVAVVTWAITPFIIAAVGELISLFIRKGHEMFRDGVFVGLLSVLFLRYFYSFCVGFWLPRNMKERAQYFVGYFLHFLTSPFMNIIIMLYSLFNSDDFKWGKTREVIQGEDDAEKDAAAGRGTH
ncbi:glycosyltransferase family 2 [Trichoderma arundinaceum]|uniref:chitin synthase n=1 Tax=Trichoderma arundinaceum TaxID=490622 RepID=A0A395NLB7_TRIAR|nr:glycosyltransferase family 2 [Trichoderma arundinaceum]